MKKIEDLIADLDNVEFDNNGDPLYSYEQVKHLAIHYASQEVVKHLEIAANEATLTSRKGRTGGHMLIVNKKSISDIKVELT